MTHVTDRLAAFVSDEMSGAESDRLREHLQVCHECSQAAADEQRVWDSLESIRCAGIGLSVWSAVQARTFGRDRQAWFFGRTPAVRLMLAAGTLAAGMLMGIWSGEQPGRSAGDESLVALDDSGLAGVWLEDSALHRASAGGLSVQWLALADVDEGEER